MASVQRMREYAERRFFWKRARRLSNVSAIDLARLWKRQRGLCALTGMKLDRTAHLDHKLALARGGSDALGNLQWVTQQVNLSKRDLTNDEFLALCENCMRWIGQRIAQIDAIPQPAAKPLEAAAA